MQNSNRKNSGNSRKSRQGNNDAQAFYNDQTGENPEEGRMRKENYKPRGKRGK